MHPKRSSFRHSVTFASVALLFMLCEFARGQCANPPADPGGFGAAWRKGATVTVNIDPRFTTGTGGQRAKIEQAFMGWQAANGTDGNDSNVYFNFTFNATPSVTPANAGDPATADHFQVNYEAPPTGTDPAWVNGWEDTDGRRNAWSFVTPTLEGDALVTAMAHEIGHTFGLANKLDCSSPAQSIMCYPTVSIQGPTSCDNAIVRSVGGYGNGEEEPEVCEQCYNAGGTYCDPNTGSCWTPILIDLNGNKLELTSAADGVNFDTDGDGTLERTAWTAGEDDAWLVLDRNGNGRIDSAMELFGGATPQPPAEVPNGFLALAVFDGLVYGGNGDGTIDRGDEVYSQLRLWLDVNHNGVSEPDELSSLAAAGVASISLDYKQSKRMDEHGNWLRYRGKVEDGNGMHVGRFAIDVWLLRPKP